MAALPPTGPDPLAPLRLALAGPEPGRGHLPEGATAVVAPLYVLGPRVHVLLTRRTANLASHPGQISFPGGRIERSDVDPRAAALREAHEEVGIEPAEVELLGHLCDYVTHYGRLICAYVGHVRGEPPKAPRSHDEVAELLLVDLARLRAGEGYEGRALEGARGGRAVHYWHLPEATVWGITGDLLAELLRRAYGWAPPRPPRTIGDPGGFRA